MSADDMPVMSIHVCMCMCVCSQLPGVVSNAWPSSHLSFPGCASCLSFGFSSQPHKQTQFVSPIVRAVEFHHGVPESQSKHCLQLLRSHNLEHCLQSDPISKPSTSTDGHPDTPHTHSPQHPHTSTSFTAHSHARLHHILCDRWATPPPCWRRSAAATRTASGFCCAPRPIPICVSRSVAACRASSFAAVPALQPVLV